MGSSEHRPKGALRKRLNRKGNKCRNFRVKGLGRVKGGKIGKEAGGVGEAIEVPEIVLVAVSDPTQVERRSKPKTKREMRDTRKYGPETPYDSTHQARTRLHTSHS